MRVLTGSRCGIVVAALLVFGVATSAQASLTMGAGTGVVGDSWTFSNTWNSVLDADVMELFVVADGGAGPFESPGMSGLGAPGWAVSAFSPTYIELGGPPTSTSAYTLHFAGDMAQAVSVDVIWWTGGGYGVGTNLLESFGGNAFRAEWSNGVLVNQYVYTTDIDGYNRQPIPEPTSVALLGLGLVSAALSRRRARKLV